MDVEILEIQERPPELVCALTRVWERSVRATHDFLGEDDIVEIAREVPVALSSVAQLAMVCKDGNPIAFAGAMGDKLEMLFVDPSMCGRGVGHALLAYAVSVWEVYRLDVNEQNQAARCFYEHEGFIVVARSSFDSSGRPFPLLHLECDSGIRANGLV